jgi:hypothetical protein
VAPTLATVAFRTEKPHQTPMTGGRAGGTIEENVPERSASIAAPTQYAPAAATNGASEAQAVDGLWMASAGAELGRGRVGPRGMSRPIERDDL